MSVGQGRLLFLRSLLTLSCPALTAMRNVSRPLQARIPDRISRFSLVLPFFGASFGKFRATCLGCASFAKKTIGTITTATRATFKLNYLILGNTEHEGFRLEMFGRSLANWTSMNVGCSTMRSVIERRKFLC